MPEENDGNPIANPASPIANGNSGQEDSGVRKIENEIRSGERWLIAIGIASVLLNGVIGLIYLGQLRQMRIATNEATKSSDVAAKSLAENKRQFEETLRQMRGQTQAQIDSSSATQEAANATRSAARTARDALHVSERAYLSYGAPQILWDKKAIYIPIENKGHIPSGPVHLVIHIGKNVKTADGGTYTQYKWLERNMKSIGVGTSVNFGGVEFDPDLLKQGREWFTFGITIEYNDGFTNTPKRTVEDALCTDYSQETGPVIGPCLFSNTLELLKKADGYPDLKNQILR